jgi:large subunit ribosomal protein L25
MPEVRIQAEAGRAVGSRPSRRLRAQGKVPAVIYGHGTEPIPVAVDARELRAALTTEAGLNALLSIQVAGSSHLALAREIQRHPVRGTVSHVDFQIVRRDEVVSSEVPVTLVGEATEVHRGDGVVDQQLFSLTVRATPANIPNSIEVDVSGLSIGQAIRVADLPLPPGVTTDVDPEAAVVLGQPPQVKPSDLEAEAPAGEAEGAGEAAPAGEETQASEGEGGEG